MKIELDIYTGEELKALGVFFSTLGDIRTAMMNSTSNAVNSAGLGGAAGTGPSMSAGVASEAAEPTGTKRPSGRTRAAKADEAKGNISTSPEDRKDPAVSEADQAQDAADEAAEAAKTVVKLSHDDVRGALGAYVKKFGMAAAQEDGPKLIALVLGDKSKEMQEKKDDKGNASGPNWKISEIPDDQEKLGKVVAGVNEMLEKNPFQRDEAKAA